MIELCEYGYWIGPKGEIEVLDDWMGHSDKAYAIAEKHDLPPAAGSWYGLKDAGWIPVSISEYHPVPSLMLPEHLVVRQAEAVLRMAADHCRDGQDLFIDNDTFSDPLAWGRYVRGKICTPERLCLDCI